MGEGSLWPIGYVNDTVEKAGLFQLQGNEGFGLDGQ